MKDEASESRSFTSDFLQQQHKGPVLIGYNGHTAISMLLGCGSACQKARLRADLAKVWGNIKT